jgi:type II secretory pathway pseudopilin PulG
MNMKINNEDGYMIVVVLMILSILTVIATAGTNNSITEQRSATNEQIHELSFYAADTGRAYVIEHVDLYHDDNITKGNWINFPDKDNPAVAYSMGSLESFKGKVEYIGSGLVPRGSGFEVGKFMSHRYRIRTTGEGPRGSKSEIETGFYRIGF